MQLHQLKAIHKPKKRKRVGRGGKRGTYSGRGVKGQKARAGAKKQPAVRQWIKRYPKLRGYKFGRVSDRVLTINLDLLDRHFKPGDLVTPDVLVREKLVRAWGGRTPKIKILAGGRITKKIKIKNFQLSRGAAQKIKKADGTIITNHE